MFFMLVQGQVPIALNLSLYNFYLSRTIGQSLMSSPGAYTDAVSLTLAIPAFIDIFISKNFFEPMFVKFYTITCNSISL